MTKPEDPLPFKTPLNVPLPDDPSEGQYAAVASLYFAQRAALEVAIRLEARVGVLIHLLYEKGILGSDELTQEMVTAAGRKAFEQRIEDFQSVERLWNWMEKHATRQSG